MRSAASRLATSAASAHDTLRCFRAVRHVANNSNTRLAAYSFAKLGAELSVARGGRHVGAAAGAIAGGIIGYTMYDQAMEAARANTVYVRRHGSTDRDRSGDRDPCRQSRNRKAT